MYTYIVKSAEKITGSTLLLDLDQKYASKPFTYQSGQYAAISFYHKGRPTPARCFSIVSSPTDVGKLQFSMRVKGHFTKSLASLHKGDIVKVRGAFGGFVLGIAGDNNLVFMATGIGITPFMSMLRYATSTQPSLKITLIYSCPSQDDIPFYSQLELLQQRNPNLSVVFVIGNGPIDTLSDTHAIQGHLTPDIIDTILGNVYEGRTFYICGSPPYMNSMVKNIKKRGVSKSKIMTEAFAQGAQLQTGKMQSWPYNIYALSAAGLILGSLAVTISDILKTLPPQSIFDSSNLAPTLVSTNSRQQDLDSLVNTLPALSPTAPETAAAQASDAAAAAAATAAATAATAAVSQAISTPSVPTTTVVQQPAPAPAPVQKTCTTTQSGVTTCV